MRALNKSANSGFRFFVNLCRIILGLVFLFSGTVKAIDPVGTQIKLAEYLAAFGFADTLLDITLLIMACVLAGIEMLLGAYMLLGVFRKGTSLLLLIFMGLVTPFTLYVAINNPVSDCGCFGDAVILTNWQTFGKNLILLAFAIVVFCCKKLVSPWVRDKWQWVVTVIVLAVAGRFIVENTFGLPAVDFRPYKIGTDLKTAVLQHQDERMNDLVILDSGLNDVTAEVLDSAGYTFVIVSPHLEKANYANLDRIDDLTEYCSQYGYRLLCLTASGREEIREWTNQTAAEYQFLQCDEVPLETMVRSNPGVVLLKDGVLLNKWSHRDIPSYEQLCDSLDNLKELTAPFKNPMDTPLGVALIILLPLLLLALIDKLFRMIL